MNKKLLLTSLLLCILSSCGKVENINENWHINTLDMAKVYFLKYYEHFEKVLNDNNLDYVKKFDVYFKGASEGFSNNIYYIGDDVKYDVCYTFNSSNPQYSRMSFSIDYNTTSIENILNIPQIYKDIMLDLIFFSSLEMQEIEYDFDPLLEAIGEKYASGRANSFSGYGILKLGADDEYTNSWLEFNNESFKLTLHYSGFLTDINIWDQ